MSQIKGLQIELSGVGSTLINKRFSVPMYQRAYSWEEKQVSDLVFDLENAINNEEDEYFIGSVVLTKSGNGRFEIVDGQQRIATITMIVSLIRDYFYGSNDIERANEIESRYLLHKDLITLELIPKVQLNQIDNDFFVKAILTKPDSPERRIKPSKKSHEKILEAATIVNNKIKSITRCDNPVNSLLRWISFITDKLKVIWVMVDDDTNAFVVFETLNDRGLKLAITDLLKNYLFGLANDRILEIQNNWISMLSILEAASNDDDFVIDFIRHYWSSNFGVVREKDLYYNIKEKVKTKTKAIELSQELENSAKTYAASLNPDHDYWNRFGDNTKIYISTLNLLGISQIRPLLIAILENFQSGETERALYLIISWSVRSLIHGKLGSGPLETSYCESAQEIRRANIKNSRELYDNLKNIIPDDLAFRNSFENATVSKTVLARYYLRALEAQTRGISYCDFISSDNTDKFNLEHIMPSTYQPNWNSLKKDEHRSFVNRIGNLALLRTRINSELKSSLFCDKKEVYACSDFNTTSIIAGYEKWDKAEIIDRQRKLAELALKAWPLV
ncbi:MAG: DUF262 domain-containing protein [Bacteroidota bacterium]